MIEAAEEYVRRNPIYAPQLVRFRDVRDSDRMRRADLSDLDGDGMPDVYDLDGDGVPDPDPLYPRWLTLSDEYLQLPSGLRLDVWVPPGGVRPGSDDILPPNTLLVHSRQLDGDMPWCDPSLHCYFRAHAIFTAIHEGGRQMQEGLKGTEVADCVLLEGALNVFRVDIEIMNDFLNNGVPVPGGPNCFFPEANFQLIARSELKGAEDDFEALCSDLEKLGCPKPADCQ